MAFPVTRVPVKVELQLGGVWTDVTAYVRVEDRITITRGRRDEAGSFEPGECSLVFNNQAGRFSPRNPAGPYYGLLTRNTPIRISAMSFPTTRLYTTAASDRMFAPDTAGLSITGDIDLRVEAALNSWAVDAGTSLVNKMGTPGQRGYRLGVFSGGLIFIDWSADGTNELFLNSNVALPRTVGRQAIRATLDVDNGASGKTATFYYASTIAGPWTQLGDAVTSAGTTSIFNGTDTLKVGATGATIAATGAFYAAEVRQGIGGTVRANPDFTAQTNGATSFADAVGNTWTIENGAALTDRRYRFHGEVPSWPQEWDISERDVWVSVQAAGVLRRLGQGAAPLLGPIQRSVLRDTANTKAYWPLEDQTGSTSIASGLPAGPAMVIEGSPRLAQSEVFAASGPLPEMAQAYFLGPVTPYTATGTLNARCLLYVPAAGDVDQSVIMRVFTTGTAAWWDVVLSAAGSLTVKAYDNAGTLILSSGAAFGVNGKQLVVVLELVQNGANIDWTLTTVSLVSGAGLLWSGTLNTRTAGAATYVQVNASLTLDETVIGHVTVRSAGASDVDLVLGGYAGETAGSRIERLCSEEGVPFAGGGGADSVAMGVQRADQLLTLLAECEASDMGQLYESRDQPGLAYRSRNSRAIQSAALALNYSALRELNPVEDDQNTRNDITVSRIGGSSARATVDTGPLSTQAPPNGVGRYDEQVDLSLDTDAQCADQANLRVTMGTIDEPRYPVLSVQLAGTAFAASAALMEDALDVDHGDRITVTGAPVWVPRGTIDQHTIGQVETLGVREYRIDYVCQPATPIGAADLWTATTFRWAADGSTLNATMTTTATSVTVATEAGKPLWTTTDVPLDIVVGGEQITVGAISGASSPQTFSSLTRSVNGVVKTHATGEAVQIADPTYYAL